MEWIWGQEVWIWYGRWRAGVTTESERQLYLIPLAGRVRMKTRKGRMGGDNGMEHDGGEHGNGNCIWYGWLASTGGAEHGGWDCPHLWQKKKGGSFSCSFLVRSVKWFNKFNPPSHFLYKIRGVEVPKIWFLLIFLYRFRACAEPHPARVLIPKRYRACLQGLVGSRFYRLCWWSGYAGLCGQLPNSIELSIFQGEMHECHEGSWFYSEIPLLWRSNSELWKLRLFLKSETSRPHNKPVMWAFHMLTGMWPRTPMSFVFYLVFSLIFEGVPKSSVFHKNCPKSTSMSSVFWCFSMPPQNLEHQYLVYREIKKKYLQKKCLEQKI